MAEVYGAKTVEQYNNWLSEVENFTPNNAYVPNHNAHVRAYEKHLVNKQYKKLDHADILLTSLLYLVAIGMVILYFAK